MKYEKKATYYTERLLLILKYFSTYIEVLLRMLTINDLTVKDKEGFRTCLSIVLFEVTNLIIKMYQTDLTETDWDYITKVLNLQTRKRKIENERRLCRNYELTFESAEERVKIAAIKLLLKKI